ncbi:MAG: acyl-CoA dehydrogenase family protein [Kofleriaceae bacterium]
MDFALDDDQQLIVDTVRRFSERDLRGWAADADRAGAPPEKFAHAAGELGLFLDAVPAEHGGLLEGAYSHTTRALRGYELGRGCAALAALCECNVETALAVGAWGDAATKKAVFEALGSGKTAPFVNLRGGGALNSPFTGKLPATPGLATASHVLVYLADGKLVLLDATKLRIKPITPSGWRAAQWATAEAEAVPATLLSDNPAHGAQVLAWARASLAARAVGVSVAAMEYADAYGKERVQFGQPIGTFESLIRLRDDALTTAAAARLLALHAAWLIDRGAQTANDTASRARVIAGDCVTRATIDAVQIFGGYGFVNDYPVEKLMRDARAFEALHGNERFDRVLAQKVA